ncbi:MAG: dUTP diphosphatase [Candidatus Heimdallarchaeota archaeon]|nr:dUTP diphosphatase [Candidatus Heimdallarchaeota archaeon]
MVEVKVKLLEPTARMPTFATDGDVCADLRSIKSLKIDPGEYKTIRTGIAIELQMGWEAQIRPRSGLAAKHGLFITNSPGTIDSGYRGEIMVLLANFSKKDYTVVAGDRIAQMAIRKVPDVNFIESEKTISAFVSTTTRGATGLGSTGVT